MDELNLRAPVSRSKSHSKSVWAEVRRRRRETSGEISRGSVRKATPERLRVESKMLRRPLTTAPPKLGSRKYFWVRRQEMSSSVWQEPGVASAPISLPTERVGSGLRPAFHLGRVGAVGQGRAVDGAGRARAAGVVDIAAAEDALGEAVLEFIGVGDDVGGVEAEDLGKVVDPPGEAVGDFGLEGVTKLVAEGSRCSAWARRCAR